MRVRRIDVGPASQKKERRRPHRRQPGGPRGGQDAHGEIRWISEAVPLLLAAARRVGESPSLGARRPGIFIGCLSLRPPIRAPSLRPGNGGPWYRRRGWFAPSAGAERWMG